MARKPLKFKETELVRAIRAADKAGGHRAVEISKDGVIRIVPVALTPAPESQEDNPWDKK